jgi:hypothetical protein
MVGSTFSKWFSPIESRQDALKVIKDSSNALFFVAALQVAMSFFLRAYSILWDAALLVLLSFILRRFNSRAAAVILLVVAVAEAGVTFANRVGMNLGGGNNVILAVIIVYAAYRATRATYKLREFTSDPTVGAGPSDT